MIVPTFRPQRLRPTAATRAALAAAIVGLALVSPARASATSGTSGSLSFDLSVPYIGTGTIDLNAQPWSSIAGLQLTKASVTFTAQVLPDMHTISNPDISYTLRSFEQGINPPGTNCYGLPVAWCGFERYAYEGERVKTLSQSDLSVMQVGVGGIAGSDNTRGTLTESSLELRDYRHEETRDSRIDRTDPAAPGLVEIYRSYDIYEYERMVWSSKTQLSVTLDLDAAALADLSSTGLLNYYGSAYQAYNPMLRFDYEAISAVPEPQSAGLALAGLLMVAAVRARRNHAPGR